LRPATDRAGPYGKPGKSLQSASNSRFVRGIPVYAGMNWTALDMRKRVVVSFNFPQLRLSRFL
jgi:hypothetical protein